VTEAAEPWPSHDLPKVVTKRQRPQKNGSHCGLRARLVRT